MTNPDSAPRTPRTNAPHYRYTNPGTALGIHGQMISRIARVARILDRLLAQESRIPQLSVVPRFIFYVINSRGELTATKLGADPATGLELGSLFHHVALIVEDERITAGQDRLGRECL